MIKTLATPLNTVSVKITISYLGDSCIQNENLEYGYRLSPLLCTSTCTNLQTYTFKKKVNYGILRLCSAATSSVCQPA